MSFSLTNVGISLASVHACVRVACDVVPCMGRVDEHIYRCMHDVWVYIVEKKYHV